MPDQKPLQEGGFMMSDETIPTGGETLYAIMKKHFNKLPNKTFFDSVLQQKVPPGPPLDIAFLDTPDYKDIYTKLINIIMTDEVYTQTFSDGGGKPFFTHSGMHNYHIQLCALMTMSFLIELELFSVVHNYIPINIDKEQKNNLPSVFADNPASTPPVRFYSSKISGGVDAILKYFTDTLDNFFNDFMTQLLVQIQRYVEGVLTPQEILESIVPVNSKDPPHRAKTFDFIYVNWKDLIARKIQDKMTPAAYIAGFYPRRINQAIQSAISHVESGGSKYIAEGTGFFSFLYLLPKHGVLEKYNGSCITYSMLELYIMARLHVNANNLTLNMEIQPDDPPPAPPIFRPHRTWLTIQNDPDINLSAVSHWATRYSFASHQLRFRVAYDGLITTQYLFNFVDPDKSKLCLLLLYPIFDSYNHYLRQPDMKLPKTEINPKLLKFIQDRIIFVKLLFTKKTVSTKVDEKTRLGMKPLPPPKRVTATWFTNVFGFEENAANFATTQKASFDVKRSDKDKDHILMTVNKRKDIDIGVFRYRSVKQLLDVASANTSAKSVFGFDPTKNLKYYTVTSTASAVHTNPSYYGSIFQVASQFNALEMPNQGTTPQQGITKYVLDKTQGPVCAMVCPFGTLYRNYFSMPNASTNEQPADKSVNSNPQTGTASGGTDPGNNQINTLTELMKIPEFNGLRFQNGYIFVKDKTQLDAINKYLSTPENFWKAMMAIKYVIQEDTPVVNLSDGKILDHKVSQIYCSAYPVAYSIGGSGVPGTSAKDYALLSSMILHAVYYSTLAYAVSRITEDDIRKKVFLTKVGGGVFENNMYLIHTAIHNAVRHFIAYPIDVYIVNYGAGVDPNPIETTIDELKGTIVKATDDDAEFEGAPYTDIQSMLAEKAKDETEKVKIETEKKVSAEKEEDTKLRLSLKKSTGDTEDLDKKTRLEEKAKAKAERARVKAEKKEADKIHEEKTKKKHLNLKETIDKAIKTFSEKLTAGDVDDKKYAKILNELMTEIEKDREVRAKADAEADAKSKTGKKTKGKVKKSGPEPASKQMSLDDVIKFINSKPDAIFVVTGGSFNPPHNGHIGMFQKAYEALETKNPGKKVYGVMVPADVTHLDRKVTSGVLLEAHKIAIKNRVDLCSLSCDNYTWTNPGKFDASNMIVVNEGNNGPAGSILQTSKTSFRDNAYYLCGSDYYAGYGTGKYKFICVLRSGVKVADLKMTFDKAPKEDGVTEYPVKPDDIIIEGGEDSEASSTSLREMLTEISKLEIREDTDIPPLPNKLKLLALISMPVLRRLLELKYILTDAEKNKTILKLMDIDLDAPDAKSSNDTDSKLKGKAGVTTGGDRSLANMGQTCYMNAALQLIYSMTDLRGSTNMPELEAYLKKMDAGVVSTDRNLAEDLYARANADGFASGRSFNQQEDSSELLIKLFDRCANKNMVQFNQIDGIFVPRDIRVAKADVAACALATDVKKHTLYNSLPLGIQNRVLHIPPTSDVKQTIYNIQLEDRDIDGKTISQIFNESLLPTLHSGIPPYLYEEPTATFSACKQFSEGSVDTQNVIIPDPNQQYLIIALMRYTRGGSKIITPIKLTDAGDILLGNTTTFYIKGCISHHGDTPKGGHYTYVEFKDKKPYMVYDDSNITPYDSYVKHVGGRTVDTEGYVLLFERE